MRHWLFTLIALPCCVVALHAASFTIRAEPAGPQRVQLRAGARTLARVDILRLASIRRLVHPLTRDRATMSDGELVAAWSDVSLVIAAVAGVVPDVAPTFAEVAAAAAADARVEIVTAPGVAARDDVAEKLLAVGYSARETADVLGRRITQRALDTARRMIAVGVERQQAARYLDSQYRLARNILTAPPPAVGDARRRRPSLFDPLIERFAALHRVESDIVRAIIATESDFNPAARSRAGALGLMQLMPGTARELGVDPLVPAQNIEGGVRYFSQLFDMFGTLELALVAYNAGPGFAARYARGETGLYGETREYVARVLTRLRDPQGDPASAGVPTVRPPAKQR